MKWAPIRLELGLGIFMIILGLELHKAAQTSVIGTHS